MTIKAKILIGIFIPVIIVVVGWRTWEGRTLQRQEGICGPEGKGPSYDVANCDKSCIKNDDCKFTCGCGAINRNEICHDEGIIYDCVVRITKCESGKCVAGEEIISIK